MAMTRPVVSGGVKVAIVSSKDVPCLLNQRVCRFNILYNLDKKFVYSLLFTNRFISYIKELSIGSQQLNLSCSDIEDYIIPLPPLPEQHRIATVLSTLDECIEKTEALIAKLKQVKAGLMQDLLTREIDTEGRIRDESTHEFKDTEIGRVPVEWDVQSWNSICEQISVGVVIKPASYYVENCIPALRSLNIDEDKFNLNTLVYFSEKDNSEALTKSKLRENDLVVVRTGSPGIAAVITKKMEGINCIDLLFLRVTKEITNPYFLSKYFNSTMGKIELAKHLTGLAQKHLNVSAIQRTNISIPSLIEQNRIVYHLTSLDDRISYEEKYLNKLLAQQKGFMNDLLTGNVRTREHLS